MDTRSDKTRNSGGYIGATLLIAIGLCGLVANGWDFKPGHRSC